MQHPPCALNALQVTNLQLQHIAVKGMIRYSLHVGIRQSLRKAKGFVRACALLMHCRGAEPIGNQLYFPLRQLQACDEVG